MNEGLFVAPALAVTLSAVAVWLLRRAAPALPRDIPNSRSLHALPVPRAGGYAVWLGFVAAALIFPPVFPGGFRGWLLPWAALAAVSALDDVREVRVVPRLAVHSAAALWCGGWLAVAWNPGANSASIIAATLAIALVLAWSANLYNFMDGTDGLAASMGAIGFLAYGLAIVFPPASQVDAAQPGIASAPAFFALAAAILPFLAVNRPRASMFLGDVGALPLGFLAGAFGIAGVAGGTWPAWFPILIFLPFIADATLTLARRARRRERLWEGHRSHFYQRLHQLGAGHAGTLAVYVVAMIGTATTALACRIVAADAGWWALGAWIAVVCMLFAMIDYHWRKKTNIPAQVPR
jgi:UDP-N-acetylmuramyl pentapeptide phosphotransferase/UDP-N-acetylglucosamine-1-phosphate transferase